MLSVAKTLSDKTLAENSDDTTLGHRVVPSASVASDGFEGDALIDALSNASESLGAWRTIGLCLQFAACQLGIRRQAQMCASAVHARFLELECICANRRSVWMFVGLLYLSLCMFVFASLELVAMTFALVCFGLGLPVRRTWFGLAMAFKQ
jgi:hypothetical protein